MLLTVAELEHAPISFDMEVPAGQVDFGDEVASVQSFHMAGVADLLKEHRGPHETVADIRVRAGLQARVEVLCARCLEPVPYAIDSNLDLLFRPLGVDAAGDDRSISPTETEIGYYGKDGLLLEDVMREQVLLALPARTLCGPSCKGLCPHCGHNRNTGPCDCADGARDPRWSTLGALRHQERP